jgi:hypothetical protein
MFDRLKVLCLAASLMLGSGACTVKLSLGPSQQDINIGPTAALQPTYTRNPTYTPWPTFTPMPTYTPRPTYTYLPVGTGPAPTGSTTQAGELTQYAKTASASSQKSATDGSASQAAGYPGISICGDSSRAWASAVSNGKDWLLLTFEKPVVPTRIVIHQNLNPGAIVLVEVINEKGKVIPVYTAAPTIQADCPYNLDIEVTGVKGLVHTVRITLDQTNHNGWNEIDAVELTGTPG